MRVVFSQDRLSGLLDLYESVLLVCAFLRGESATLLLCEGMARLELLGVPSLAGA